MEDWNQRLQIISRTELRLVVDADRASRWPEVMKCLDGSDQFTEEKRSNLAETRTTILRQ